MAIATNPGNPVPDVGERHAGDEDPSRLARFAVGHSRVLELIATGASLTDSLDALVPWLHSSPWRAACLAD